MHAKLHTSFVNQISVEPEDGSRKNCIFLQRILDINRPWSRFAAQLWNFEGLGPGGFLKVQLSTVSRLFLI